jgi:predicted AlkP superfamily pyrophosphatase or phosphodiesterase
VPAEQLERAVDVLCDPALAQVVDLVAWTDEDRCVVVRNAGGAARLSFGGEAELLDGRLLGGRNPVADQNPLAFTPYEAELADPSPPNARNSYPLAAERLSSFFADRRAPDVVVVRTPRHYFPEAGGYLGEHGSLNVIQSRAPLILSGAGVTERGILHRWARVVDVAPTLASLAGAHPGWLEGLDGRSLAELAAPGAAHVVGLLWDGVNAGDLLNLAAAGRLPGLARLLDQGCALNGGAIAEFPSVTLTNHTSALTGLGPGRHGIVGNAYYDVDTGQIVVANDAKSWHRTAELFRPGVATVFEMVGAVGTACVNEPVDRGAAYSTMAFVRAAGSPAGAEALAGALPDPRRSRFANQAQVAADRSYAYWSAVDDAGLDQVLQLWRTAAEAPRLTWWNLTLTDAAHHAGGPRSEVARASLCDSDRRLEAFLDHLDRLGVSGDTIVLLTADHGSEAADPLCQGGWDAALRSAGVAVRDEAAGFLYLGGD